MWLALYLESLRKWQPELHKTNICVYKAYKQSIEMCNINHF